MTNEQKTADIGELVRALNNMQFAKSPTFAREYMLEAARALTALEAENRRLREAVDRVLSPAPGVRKVEPWVYGILGAARRALGEKHGG